MELLPNLQQKVDSLTFDSLSTERIKELKDLIEYIKFCKKEGKSADLNFICTHNSRRSQLSQVWAQAAAFYHGIEANCFSGGVEVTSFNERAVAALLRAGFGLSTKEGINPVFSFLYSEKANQISTFSKLYDDAVNPKSDYAAVMTCSHADENCPIIPGAVKRIAVKYDDPKSFDDTKEEAMRYDERSTQIATEMFYVFSQINA